MPLVTVVHIVFDAADDPQGFARRHIGREVGRGVRQSDVVGNAWLHRHDPVPNAITSTAFRTPPLHSSRNLFRSCGCGRCYRARSHRCTHQGRTALTRRFRGDSDKVRSGQLAGEKAGSSDLNIASSSACSLCYDYARSKRAVATSYPHR